MSRKSQKPRAPAPPLPEPPRTRHSDRWKTVAFCALIAIATFIAFAPSLSNGFINWDDNTYVTDNPDLRLPGLAPVVKAFTSIYSANWQPLTILVYIAEFRCSGLDPSGYHWVNLLLHIVNALLVFALLFRLSGRRIVAFIGALFFAVHPLRVESVAWVAELKDVLSTVFFLASLLFYIRFADTGSRRAYVLSLASLLLALLAKPMAVSLPVVLLLVDFLKGRKLNRRSIYEKLPFFALAAASAMVTIVTQKSVETVNCYQPLSLLHRIEVPFFGIVFYLFKSLAPVRLSGIYSFPSTFSTALEIRFALSVAVVIAAAVLVFCYRRQSKVLVFGALFFLATVLPVLQIVPVGSAIVAERYTYIPMIGFAFAAATGIGYLLRSHPATGMQVRGITIAVLTVLIAGSVMITRERCAVWKDNLSFWDAVIAVSPGGGAYYNRGTTLLLMKRYDRAISDLTMAIQTNPGFAQACTNRGSAYYLTGRYDKAIEDYTASLRIMPNNPDAFNDRKHAVEKLKRMVKKQ